MSNTVLVGVDVGGTFTDFVALTQDQLTVFKVPSTPDDPGRAIVEGLATLGIEKAQIVHGMTVATNALLERRGAKTALLTTQGFADVLVIGRQNRPHVYRFYQQKPESLVADQWRLEVAERVDVHGKVLMHLDEAAVHNVAAKLRHSDIESLAIVFLHSFRNPAHEARAKQIIDSHCREMTISLSSQILPEYREYERTSTTVISAYVQPLVARYLQKLKDRLNAFQIRVMQSNGGAIGLNQAVEQAARLVLSGPAGGVVGAFAIAQQVSRPTLPHRLPAFDEQLPQLITFDMGGTSTDVALCAGEVPTTAESYITDLPLRLPVLDIHTVGAGGGSIAYVDSGGGLRVGPRSAGAVPGPVCYGRGGTEPTVTDANLVLGRLDPNGFLGGSSTIGLQVDQARAAVGKLGAALGLTAEAAALGIIRVANATMERALRRVSIERGHDPQQFVLVPFGGAGALHACALADALNIGAILISLSPGVLSAFGMLVADVVSDASHAVLITASELIKAPAVLADTYTAVSRRVSGVLQREGVTAPKLEAFLDVRYRGQSFELTIPLALPISGKTLELAVSDFHRAHEQRYGYAMTIEPVEIVTLRVRGVGASEPLKLSRSEHRAKEPDAAYVGDKMVWFTDDQPNSTCIFLREKLVSGNQLSGPAIVQQFDTTVLVEPGWALEVEETGSMWLCKTDPLIGS